LTSELQKIKDKTNTYDKPHLDFPAQLERLKQNGLHIHNDAFAIKKLSHINYYRLSAYFLPFQYPKNSDKPDQFFEGVTFKDISNLYDFDAALRKVVFGALERVEVYARTQIAYYHAEVYGPFGYLHLENFQCDEPAFEMLIENIKEESRRSDEEFVAHFKAKYHTTDLPLWSVVEVLSFGTISRFYACLKMGEQKKIANTIGVHPKVLRNWLHALTIVRNICAHHSRLWNKQLRIQFTVPKKNPLFEPIKSITKAQRMNGDHKEITYDNNASVFFALSVLKYIFDAIGEEVAFVRDVKGILSAYPKVDLVAMGFVPHWEELTLWSDV
jgi:abortive infection bacteriophage resistance protein